MPTRLILITHAETAATRAGRFADDDRLTARGRDAARAGRAFLPTGSYALASPALAPRETAKALGLDPLTDPDLRDLDVGVWRGRSLADIAADPGAAAWTADPAYAGHGGESVEALCRRVADWLMAHHARRGTVLGVTHAAVLRAAIVATLDAPASAFWSIDAGPLARLTLVSDGRRWTLRGLTDS